MSPSESEFRVLLEAYRTAPVGALAKASNRHGADPRPGSRAHGWEQAGWSHALEGAWLGLLMARHAGEQLIGLSAVLESEAVGWSPRPLLRSIMEWCADAFWLCDDTLEGDPAAVGRALAVRHLLFEAVSIGHEAKIAEHAPHADWWVAWPERMGVVDDAVDRLGLPPMDRSKRNPDHWRLADVAMGTRTGRIERFLGRFYGQGAATAPWYKLWSHLTHPSATAARTLTPAVGAAGQAGVGFHDELLPLVLDWMRDALWAWASIADHTLATFGWYAGALDDWLQALPIGLRDQTAGEEA